MQELKAAATAPRSVVSWQWDYYVTGNKLFYRSGRAAATVPFQSMTLPGNAQKIAANDNSVFVWVNNGADVYSYAVTPAGPSTSATRLAPTDATAMAALNHPPDLPKHALDTRPQANVSVNPQRLLVATFNDDGITAIDTSANAVVGTLTLPVGSAPNDIAVSPNNFQAFTANFGCTTCQDKGATIIDPRTVTNTGFLTARFPSSVAVSADASTVYIADDLGTGAAASVFIRTYNTSTGVAGAPIQMPGSPQVVRVDPTGAILYSLYSDDQYYNPQTGQGLEPVDGFTSIPLSTMTPTSYSVPDGAGCVALAVQPKNGAVFLMCNNGLLGSTPVIYSATINADASVTLNNTFSTVTSYGLAFSPDGKKLYVPHFSSNTLEVLDPIVGTRLDLISVGSGPASVTVNAAGTRAYVMNYTGNSVSVIDLNSDTLIATVSTGNGPVSASLTTADATIPAGTVSATVNGASFAANTAVSAGTLVSIFGTGIGPTTGVLASTVPLPTTLGGISVTIGGKPAPLLYVSATQINAQVPFEVQGLASAAVVISNGSSTSTPVNLSLSPASPGIFTAVVNGFTQGAILNQNSTLNTPSNRTKVGDTIQIFATGQGPVSNQPASGAAAPVGPNTANSTFTPLVSIGNNNAIVSFSGLAPGYVGLWQLNAVVPVGTASGTAIPVQINQNGVLSNVTTISVQ